MSSPVPSSAPSSPTCETYSLPATRYSLLLLSYFRSGWAFLIPYLAVYLLYAWLDWPVNPATAGEGDTGQGARSWVPCLLHVYIALHVAHLGLGIAALAAGRTRRRLPSVTATHFSSPDAKRDEGSDPEPARPEPVERVEGLLAPRSSLLATLPRFVPWLCLALLFYIPGIYLEWPSDPWEHLRRINEWHAHDTVTAHSTWKKSSYFLPYSLTGHTTGLTQLSWLNFYYTGICLLLSWQYYRLGRAVGLSERASFVFVLLNALTFGNNIFSFYRYYGLSSSIVAQIGAVVLTRIALEFASRGTKLNPRLGHEEAQKVAKKIPGKATALSRPAVSQPNRSKEPALSTPALSQSSVSKGYSLLLSTAAGLVLLPLIAYNHIQGIGIAGLGILAVVVWRMIEWKRSMILWLTGAAVALSFTTVLYFPRHPAIEAIYLHAGWLTEWYGFDFFSLSSHAHERSLHIIGLIGVISIPVAIWLIAHKNHAAGWLTLMPILALVLPCTALPIAHALASGQTTDNIVAFHRFLFAVPIGMALVAAVDLFAMRRDSGHCSSPLPSEERLIPSSLCSGNRRSGFLAIMLPVSLLAFVGTPPDKVAFNRTWQSLVVVGHDLTLEGYIRGQAQATILSPADDDTLKVDDALAKAVVSTFGSQQHETTYRIINEPPLTATERTVSWFSRQYLDEFSAAQLTSPTSQLTRSAGHEAAPVLLEAAVRPREHLVADLTADTATWFSPSGASFVLTPKREGLEVANHPGQACDLFGSASIRLDPDHIYRIVYELSQTAGPPSVTYLAVSWHDESGRLLESWREAPVGAGDPAGWVNGTYSYFGLTGREPTPREWSQFEVSFGYGQAKQLSKSATHLRIGALLNYTGAPEATTVLRRVQLWERIGYAKFLLTPSQFPVSSISQAGFMSKHWPVQRVALDQLGDLERQVAVWKATQRLPKHLP